MIMYGKIPYIWSDMAKSQASVSTTGAMVAVVEVALKTFPDAATPGQAYRRALLDWLHNRQTDSKRGSLTRIEAGVTRIEAKIDTLFGYPSDLAEMVAALDRAGDAGFDWAAHGECVIEAIRERMQDAKESAQ